MERRELLKLVALTALSPKVNVLQAAVACHMDAAPAKPHLAHYPRGRKVPSFRVGI